MFHVIRQSCFPATDKMCIIASRQHMATSKRNVQCPTQRHHNHKGRGHRSRQRPCRDPSLTAHVGFVEWLLIFITLGSAGSATLPGLHFLWHDTSVTHLADASTSVLPCHTVQMVVPRGEGLKVMLCAGDAALYISGEGPDNLVQAANPDLEILQKCSEISRLIAHPKLCTAVMCRPCSVWCTSLGQHAPCTFVASAQRTGGNCKEIVTRMSRLCNYDSHVALQLAVTLLPLPVCTYAVQLPFEPGLHFLQHDASVVHLANASTSVLLRHTAPDGGAPRRKCGMCWRGGVLLCRTGSTFAAAQVAD
ncbi:hypothetical protein O3P69_019192 [Scylla paramamosain]|uniref:Uncharacterized protein n=1 Tax=Scylla paramamosain TaxID=85552 RepID=A0AAW0SWQ7_SCYPA